MVKKDDAVSPVIGVMLMLVVTIIIAGAVTLFATGVFDDIDGSSATSVSYVDFVGVDVGGYLTLIDNGGKIGRETTDYIGFVFEVLGGDPVDLRNLKLTIDDNGGTAGVLTVTYNDLLSQSYHPVDGGSTVNARITPSKALYDAGSVRMVIYPVPTGTTDSKTASNIKSSSKLIYPGEKFLIVTETISAGTSGDIMIGLKIDPRIGTSGQYVSGSYFIGGSSAKKTTLTLTDENSGAVLVDCVLSDGVIL